MSAKIFEQHNTAFRNVSAYVIVKDGVRVATVAFKSGTAVTAYVHWIGIEMTKGLASVGAYDRQNAAVSCAAQKAIKDNMGRIEDRTPATDMRAAFFRAALKDTGQRWDDAVRDAGFSVFQAV